MTTLVIAYVVVWVAVLGYLARIGLVQRRIAVRIAELEARQDQAQADAKIRRSKAA